MDFDTVKPTVRHYSGLFATVRRFHTIRDYSHYSPFAIRYSSFPDTLSKKWNGGHVDVPKQSWGNWTLFLCEHFRWVYVTYFGHRNLAQRSVTTHFPLWFIQQKAALVLVEEKRVHNMQPKYSFLFVRRVMHILWRYVCNVFKCH